MPIVMHDLGLYRLPSLSLVLISVHLYRERTVNFAPITALTQISLKFEYAHYVRSSFTFYSMFIIYKIHEFK